MVGFRNLQFLEGGNGSRSYCLQMAELASQCDPSACACLLLSLLAPPLFRTQHWTWHEGLLHLSRSTFGWRTCSSPGKVCRWNEVWREPVGAAGLAGSGPLMTSPWSGGAGTEASRQHAWFIKSHQEHCLGTAVIYSYFSLVKCY